MAAWCFWGPGCVDVGKMSCKSLLLNVTFLSDSALKRCFLWSRRKPGPPVAGLN